MTELYDTISIDANNPTEQYPSIGPPRGNYVRDADPDELIDAITRPREHDLDPDDFIGGVIPPSAGPLSDLMLPSFGETPYNDCGRPTPGTRYFCPSCATIHAKNRVCYRYQCPLHWAHAIRRRAAGSKSNAGVAPMIAALRAYLDSHRGTRQVYQHIVYNPPRDRMHKADDSLKRELQVVRELMDALGIQGLVAYHPRAGEHEDHTHPDEKDDDRGEWKKRLGSNITREELREDTEHRPHFHIIGVGYMDVSVTEAVQDETDALIHRIERYDKDLNTTISIKDDEKLAHVVTYALSHAGIYRTKKDQYRLAAWMKGPDVNRIRVLKKHQAAMQAKVYDAAEQTLGISPPNLTCDTEVPIDERTDTDDEQTPLDKELDDEFSDVAAAWQDTEYAPADNGIHIQPPTITATQASTSSWSRPNPRTSFPPSRDAWAAHTPSSSSSSQTAVPADQDDVDEPDQDNTDQEEGQRKITDYNPDTEICDGRLRHISQANQYLLDHEWNTTHTPEQIERLEDAYQGFLTYCELRNLHTHKPTDTIPEYEDTDTDDDPPPD